MINKISFKNYKSFKELQSLELKPITVLIGKNSSGKSALAKLPTLISASLTGEFTPPLKMENQGVRLGESYSDLIYNKNFVTNNLELILESKTEKLAITLKGDEKNKTDFIEYIINDTPIDLQKNKFKGFTNSETKFEELNISYDYIGPYRKLPDANYLNNYNEHNKVGIKGENAYQILINDFENQGQLMKNISDWYKENFDGWGIDIIPVIAPAPTFQFALSNQGINHINLVNVGQGMNQALPLIVRSFMQVEGDEDELIIIEEPETHLHPAAHGNLAERFVQSYLKDTKKKYLIETHSQNFVLRLRRLVALNTLKKDDLAIYFVDFDKNKGESRLIKIEVEDDGEVKYWPDNIFNESLEEVIQIRKAQDQK